MDPNACLAEISRLANATDSYDKRRRAELCRALQGWLARGGFQPDWKHHPEGLRYFAEHNADRGQADLWCAEFLREGS